jgi:hypothetical protein
MTDYVIYHPISGKIHPSMPSNPYAYCTEILAHGLRKTFEENGYSAIIKYVRVHETIENGYNIHRLEIPELGIRRKSADVPSTLWLIVANTTTNKFVCIDLQDSPGLSYRLQNNKNYEFSLIGQYSMERHSNSFKDLSRIVPFVYSCYYPNKTKELIEEIQDVRNNRKRLDPRVFFYGNNSDTYLHDGQKIREVLSVLEEKYPSEVCVGSTEKKLGLSDFFKKAATHTVSLSLPGHPWCSREHELWTLGLPVMMYEHTHHLAVELIPNYHYISVPAGDRLDIGMPRDPELAADNIMRVHRKVIKPSFKNTLDFIAKNGQDRMLTAAGYDVVSPKLFTLLNIGKW